MAVNHSLESINQNIREALFRSSEKGLIYANKAYVKIFGFKDEEEALSTPSVLVYKNPQDRQELVKKLIKDGFSENQEITFVRRDGSEFIGLISCTLLVDDEDGSIFWDGSIRDITKQREVINKLLDHEQLLNSINKNINEAIYRSVNREGLVYVNDEFARMFGYDSVEEVLSREVVELYQDTKQRRELGDEIIEKGSIFNREVAFKRKDGSTFWGYLNSIKVKGLDGKIYFDGAIRDMTREKEAEVKLKRQTRMQELLISISSRLINLPLDEVENSLKKILHELGIFADADRVFVFEFINDWKSSISNLYWNREGVDPVISDSEELLIEGQALEFFEGFKNGDNLHIPDVSAMTEGELKEVYDRQNIKTILCVPLFVEGQCIGYVGFDWVRKKHDVTSVEVLLLRLFSQMYSNITTRSTRERELRKLFEKTIEQNQRLKDFSYITSHNFRSSVANLLGLITIIEDDRNNDEFFKMLKDTSLKLNLAIDSINDLLNFEKDISALEKTDCNLYEIVADTIILNKKSAREKDIHFEIDIPRELSIKVLPAYLQSILHNLVTNAMKYGVTAEKRNIYISAKKTGEVVLLTVADEGVGIDMKRYGEKLFQLGSRFHAGMDEGHGMGLYITKQQIEAIGGRVEVESEVNKGTKFKVYLNG
ncbi:MAG: hypothetical protein Tsb0034_17260 [Ekhidna sp.]